jgi:hypothetical protein
MQEEATKLMQSGPGRNTSVRENNNDARSSVSRNAGALSADQIDTLANTYEHWRREFPDSPTMARMNAKIDFFKMLGQFPVSAEMLTATNQQLLLMSGEEVKSTPDSESRNIVVRSSASRNKAQLSAEQIDTLRDIYRSMRQNHFSPFEARINAKVAFSGIILGLPVSKDMLNAMNEQLRRMSSEELAAKTNPGPRISENASVRSLSSSAGSDTQGTVSRMEAMEILKQTYRAMLTELRGDTEAAKRSAAKQFLEMFPSQNREFSEDRIVQFLGFTNRQ